jgi:protein-disulfide isomerase
LNLSQHPLDVLYRIKTVIDRNRALAKDLDISGTPGFIVGTELVAVALDLSGSKSLIARARNGK